jgi:hypothetical protein
MKENNFRAAEEHNGTLERGIALLAVWKQQQKTTSMISTYFSFIYFATKPFSAPLRSAAIHATRGPSICANKVEISAGTEQI